MSDSKIKDVADSIKGVAEAVPVYQDLAQPAAKELGSALQTLAKSINVVLAPISVLVWGYEQIRDFVSTNVADKLKNVPSDRIATPKPNVAGPALESLRWTGHDETLRDMYANLLAASMDTQTASGSHPAFVEIIKQLTPDEAKILRLFTQDRPFPLLTVRWEYKVQTETERGGNDALINFSLLGEEAGCQCPDLTPTFIDNLCRLGLIVVPTFFQYVAKDAYTPLEEHPYVRALKENLEAVGRRVTLNRNGARLTELGKQFVYTCMLSHDEKRLESSLGAGTRKPP